MARVKSSLKCGTVDFCVIPILTGTELATVKPVYVQTWFLVKISLLKIHLDVHLFDCMPVKRQFSCIRTISRTLFERIRQI